MGSKRDATKAAALIRDEKALKLRLEHKTHAEIDAALKYGSRQNVGRAIKRRIRALTAECAETAADVKAMELARLDAMAAGLWKKAAKGDTAAIDRMLKIQERRSAYEGLDVPKALHVELARNIDGLLERIKHVVSEDVYEQVLAAAAGVDGPPQAGGAAGSEDASEDQGGAEPR